MIKHKLKNFLYLVQETFPASQCPMSDSCKAHQRRLTLLSRSNIIIQHKNNTHQTGNFGETITENHKRGLKTEFPNSPKQQNLKEMWRLQSSTSPWFQSTDQTDDQSMQATKIQYKSLHFYLILSVRKLNWTCGKAQIAAPPSLPATASSRSQPCKSFTEMIVSRLRGRCQSLRLLITALWDNLESQMRLFCISASLRLRLEVSAEVSDLGISHEEIGVPHTGWILQREEVRAQIRTQLESLFMKGFFVDGVLVSWCRSGRRCEIWLELMTKKRATE